MTHPVVPNAFERELGIPQPKCCSTAECCKGVSPSTPFYTLFERAASGYGDLKKQAFARNFLSIMIPYASHDAARAITPDIVERTLKSAQTLDDFKDNANDVVFYHCRYLLDNNKCGIHEDRPQFCRDYPDTPFVVMSPNCAFVPWAKACKAKYNAMKDELKELETLKAELAELNACNASVTNVIDEAAWAPDNTPTLGAPLMLGASWTLCSPLTSYGCPVIGIMSYQYNGLSI